MNKLLVPAALALVVSVGSHDTALAGSHVIPAHSTQAITFYGCPYFDLVAEGDGDTDLDFVLYDPTGRPIRDDFDLTDMMVESIGHGRCGTYRLEVENLGPVWNELDLSVIRNR